MSETNQLSSLIFCSIPRAAERMGKRRDHSVQISKASSWKQGHATGDSELVLWLVTFIRWDRAAYLPSQERDLLDDGRLDNLLSGKDGPCDSVHAGRRYIGNKVALERMATGSAPSVILTYTCSTPATNLLVSCVTADPSIRLLVNPLKQSVGFLLVLDEKLDETLLKHVSPSRTESMDRIFGFSGIYRGLGSYSPPSLLGRVQRDEVFQNGCRLG